MKDIQDLLKNKSQYRMSEQKGYQGIPDDYYDGNQGEYNETFVFYKHKGLPEGVFMKETYHTDSYGSGNSLVNVEFVEGKTKQITVYEPI